MIAMLQSWGMGADPVGVEQLQEERTPIERAIPALALACSGVSSCEDHRLR